MSVVGRRKRESMPLPSVLQHDAVMIVYVSVGVAVSAILKIQNYGEVVVR